MDHGEDITPDPVAEILLRRDAILEAIAFAAERFLRAPAWETALPDVLERLGKAAGVSRCYVYRNALGPDGGLMQDMIAEWSAPGIAATLADPDNHDYPYSPDYEHYVRDLSRGRVMLTRRSDASGVDLEDLIAEDILSSVFVPVLDGPDWWGYFGFDDCLEEREWTQVEMDALKIGASTLGAAIVRQRAEQARLDVEERYRTLVEQIPAVTYVEGAERGVVFPSPTLFISPQIEAITGYRAEEFVADRDLWPRIVHPDDLEAFRGADIAAGGRQGRFEAEYRIRAKDGHVVWVHDEAILLEGFSTQWTGYEQIWHGVIYDVSALRAALEREQDLTARLREIDEMKTTFLNAVSHDLRTPVSAILGLSLTIERDEGALEESERREFAGRIAANARKLNRIVTDLLDMDRLSRGVLELERRRAELDRLVVRMLEETELGTTHPVTMELEPTVADVDVTKVERIVENLLLNAAKHTPRGTRVRVTVRPEDGGALIVVEDEGPGVPADIRDSVFEPFMQGSESRALGGVGVGLSVVQRFAEMHGGRAWVEDRTGGGASFRVFLPGNGE